MHISIYSWIPSVPELLPNLNVTAIPRGKQWKEESPWLISAVIKTFMKSRKMLELSVYLHLVCSMEKQINLNISITSANSLLTFANPESWAKSHREQSRWCSSQTLGKRLCIFFFTLKNNILDSFCLGIHWRNSTTKKEYLTMTWLIIKGRFINNINKTYCLKVWRKCPWARGREQEFSEKWPH